MTEQDIPSLNQFTAAFIRDFREESMSGAEAAVPIGDAEVFLDGIVPLSDLLAPLIATAWATGYKQGISDAITAANPDNPYGELSLLPTEQEADTITGYE